MPTISNARLEIAVDLPRKESTVTVTAQLRFSAFEMFLMQNGLRFSADCTVWGEDLGQGHWLDADDYRIAYDTKFYPDSSPVAVETVTFRKKVANQVLDEDLGTDEIYAQLTVKNMHDGTAVKAKTNVVRHSF